MSRHLAQSSDAPAEKPNRDAHVSLPAADLFTQLQVCAQLGISDDTWMRWRKAGSTPAAVVMPSGRLKWRRADIDRLAGKPEERPGRRLHFGSVHGRESAPRVA